MGQPRRKTLHLYIDPTNSQGRTIFAIVSNRAIPRLADNEVPTGGINCRAWHKWHRRWLRHQRMMRGKHTGRARRAR